MIDFTGERFIPTVTMEEEIAVEHLQRYLSVLELVQGKIVLDAACGEGYGTSLMSESAKKCYGVDISEDVIRHAKNKYSSFGLEYLASSVNNLPFKDGAFDIIISFETIEHLDDISQKSFMGEIKRTLKNEGALVISTPDKIVYSEGNRAPNKFHLKEFYRDEFYSFLKKHFMFVDFFYQKRQAASVLSQPDQKKLKVVHSKEFGFGTYIVAVCSAVKLRPKASLGSIIYDLDNKYVRNVNRILELQQEVEKLGAWGTSLKALVDEKNNTIKRCQFYIASNERQLKEIQEISGEEKEKRLSEISLMKEEVADLQEAHNKASRELSSAKQYEKDIQDKFFSLKEKLSRERENRDRDTQKLKEYEFDKVKRQEELRELQQKNEHITREFHF
ncbi:methyltransferase domain-containing protein, partial [candidate division KSB1 bacterium]|nr:methyltransferase domain-containing protein [candidate division KSB1 bacterium]